MRGYTSINNVSASIADADSLATVHVGDPFAVLVKVPGRTYAPTEYALGVLTANAPPGQDVRAGGFGGHTVTGKVVVLSEEGTDGASEWKDRVLDAHTYTCTLKLIVELDPDMTDALTYTFTLASLSGIRDALVSMTEEMQGWDTLRTLRTTSSGKAPPLPLHDDLVHHTGEPGHRGRRPRRVPMERHLATSASRTST